MNRMLALVLGALSFQLCLAQAYPAKPVRIVVPLAAGVAGYQSDTWYALLAPAGMPEPVTAKLQSATQAAIRSATLREKFMQQGAEPVSGSSRELTELLRNDLARWRKVVMDTGVQVD